MYDQRGKGARCSYWYGEPDRYSRRRWRTAHGVLPPASANVQDTGPFLCEKVRIPEITSRRHRPPMAGQRETPRVPPLHLNTASSAIPKSPARVAYHHLGSTSHTATNLRHCSVERSVRGMHQDSATNMGHWPTHEPSFTACRNCASSRDN